MKKARSIKEVYEKVIGVGLYKLNGLFVLTPNGERGVISAAKFDNSSGTLTVQIQERDWPNTEENIALCSYECVSLIDGIRSTHACKNRDARYYNASQVEFDETDMSNIPGARA
jgi:hypothetical protein